MLWSPNPDPDTWRYRRRHTVLGKWYQIKQEMWEEHLKTCGKLADLSDEIVALEEY